MYVNNQTKFKDLFYRYENFTINKKMTSTKYNICPNCNTKMEVISNFSELVCSKCGLTECLYGTVFEVAQFYNQTIPRTKHGSYDPSKHCRYWVERIQARETKDIPGKVLNGIKYCINRNKIKSIDDITCEVIRKYLREIGFTKFNEHVPLIRKLITGINPPQLTDRELQLINIYFDKVIKIYDIIKTSIICSYINIIINANI